MFIWSSYDVPIMTYTWWKEGGGENLNGGFEALTCRSTKTALLYEVHIICTSLSCLRWIIYKRASKGNASLLFLDAWLKTTPTEPILHRTHNHGSWFKSVICLHNISAHMYMPCSIHTCTCVLFMLPFGLLWLTSCLHHSLCSKCLSNCVWGGCEMCIAVLNIGVLLFPLWSWN